MDARMKTLSCVITIFLFTMGLAFAQAPAPALPAAAVPADAAAQAQQRLQIASTSEDYPVTPGDEYRLSYRQGDSVASLSIDVQSDWTVGLGVFGRMQTSGMSFLQLKDRVEKLLLAGYPRSMPSLTLVSLGAFRVLVEGELPQVSYVVAWGLSRVSDVLAGVSAPSASNRNVQVVSRDGTSRFCDLFKASRNGLLQEDPYVKAGDTIVLSRSERRIRLVGEVREPGTYELLPEDRLGDLLDAYGGGALSTADVARIQIDGVEGDMAVTRRVNMQAEGAETTALKDGDAVTVHAVETRLQVVSFEGAIIVPANIAAAAATGTSTAGSSSETTQKPAEDYGRLLYSFREGETLSDALAAVRGSLSPLADLASAFVIHEGRTEPIYVDLRLLIGSSSSSSDIKLEPNDRIVVPQSRFFVYLSGGVKNPGAYPYTPDRNFQYYVTLAGGNDQEDPRGIVILDRAGMGRDPAATIQSEDRIYVAPALITVQGAVSSPGSFAFRVNLPASYYIALAGGNDPDRNSDATFKVFDKEGKEKKSKDPLASGDRIYLPTTNGMYNLLKYTPLLATIVTTIWTIVLIYTQIPH